MGTFIQEYGLVVVGIIAVSAVVILGNVASNASKKSMASTFNTMMGEIGTVEHYNEPESETPEASPDTP